MGYFLESNGLGPAVIKSLKAVVGDKEIPILNLECWNEVVDEIDLTGYPFTAWHIHPDTVHKTGDTTILFALTKTNCPQLWKKDTFDPVFIRIVSQIQKVKIIIKYECLYGNKFEYGRYSS